jgi:hypothetical protein
MRWCLLDEALRENRDRDVVALATTLPAFGKATMVPQPLYSLEELRLNKIDATQLLSPMDKTLGDVKRNLQFAAIAGGVVAWWQLGLELQFLGQPQPNTISERCFENFFCKCFNTFA